LTGGSPLGDHIHDDVCANSYDAERGTFTQFYDSGAWMPRCFH
jgi:hypothetical protein